MQYTFIRESVDDVLLAEAEIVFPLNITSELPVILRIAASASLPYEPESGTMDMAPPCTLAFTPCEYSSSALLLALRVAVPLTLFPVNSTWALSCRIVSAPVQYNAPPDAMVLAPNFV